MERNSGAAGNMGSINKIFVAFLLIVIVAEAFVIFELYSVQQDVQQPPNEIALQENSAQVYFCPEDNCEQHLLETLGLAKNTVHFLTYSFTLDEVERKIVDLHNNGVDVKGVFEDQENSEKYSAYFPMKKAGIDVRIDSNPALMHNKITIIDGEIIMTGSMNYSANGNTRNDENLIIIKSKEIAALYEGEFKEIFEEAT
jgi:phosphatidylserine/phosphatidylglycerophosphate/cardiolipin synthase-like enzyme